MTSSHSTASYIRIHIRGREDVEHTARELGLFLYDFDTLYELARLATDPAYAAFRFSRFALYRGHRRLRPEDQMKLESIFLASPLEVVAAIAVCAGGVGAVAGAIWTVVQVIEKISNMRLNHRKLELEVRRLEREDRAAAAEPYPWPDPAQTMRYLEEREALEYVDIVTRRLSRSAISIAEFDIALTGPTPEPPWEARS